LPQLATAQGGGAPDEVRKRLESDRGRLEATEKRSKELQKDLEKIAAERQRINARLVETAKLIQQSEAQLNLIEQRLGELAAQEKHLVGQLEQSHGKISAVLAAMLRMGRNPPPVMVTSPKDVLSAFRSGMLSTSVFFELKGEAFSLSEKLNDLVRVMTSIREESDKLRRETARLDDARVRLAGAQEEKRQSLAERQAELAQVRQAAAEFTKNVADLGELIAKLDKEVQEKTGLGSYEREIAAAAPAPPHLRSSLRRPAQSRPRAAPPASSLHSRPKTPARPSCSRRAATASPC
jgi:septal ring factor EnvC (AmiA/AmiB activator)